MCVLNPNTGGAVPPEFYTTCSTVPCMPTQSWGHGIMNANDGAHVTQSDGSKSVHNQVVLERSVTICEDRESLTLYIGIGIKLRNTYMQYGRSK